MLSGGWTPGRLAVIAVLAFAAGLAATFLVAYGGAPAAALVAVAFLAGGRALLPRVSRSAAAAEQHRERLRSRAVQQDAWAARGDIRGVYGTEGAELMRIVSPPAPILPPGDDLEVAEVVHTPAELAAMLESKPPCWRYAAFVSVLVQRRAGVRDRVRDALLGFAAPSGPEPDTDLATGLFYADRLSELSALIDRLNDFMLSPAFQGVFGRREEFADADGIVHAAHRLMDYHEQFLALNESCRGVQVRWSCTQLQRDFGRLTALPVASFDTFIETFTERIAEMADVARYATGDVQMDPVTLDIADDDRLLDRVSEGLQQIARSA